MTSKFETFFKFYEFKNINLIHKSKLFAPMEVENILITGSLHSSKILASYTSQQNGFVEHKQRHILKTRGLNESNMSKLSSYSCLAH